MGHLAITRRTKDTRQLDALRTKALSARAASPRRQGAAAPGSARPRLRYVAAIGAALVMMWAMPPAKRSANSPQTVALIAPTN